MPAINAQKLHLDQHLIFLKIWYGSGDDMQYISGVACVLGHDLFSCGWNRHFFR